MCFFNGVLWLFCVFVFLGSGDFEWFWGDVLVTLVFFFFFFLWGYCLVVLTCFFFFCGGGGRVFVFLVLFG